MMIRILQTLVRDSSIKRHDSELPDRVSLGSSGGPNIRSNARNRSDLDERETSYLAGNEEHEKKNGGFSGCVPGDDLDIKGSLE